MSLCFSLFFFFSFSFAPWIITLPLCSHFSFRSCTLRLFCIWIARTMWKRKFTNTNSVHWMPTNRELRQQLVDAVRFKSKVDCIFSIFDWIFFTIFDWIFFHHLVGIVIISEWIFTIWDLKVYYYRLNLYWFQSEFPSLQFQMCKHLSRFLRQFNLLRMVFDDKKTKLLTENRQWFGNK